MTRYNIILQNEVEREWKEKRMKDTEKINHLERKLVRIRREKMRARSTTGVRWDQSNNPRGCNNDTSPKVCYI